MSESFKATADEVQALATFLEKLTDLSFQTGVWLGVSGTTSAELPNGASIDIGRAKEANGEDEYNWAYIVDTVTGY